VSADRMRTDRAMTAPRRRRRGGALRATVLAGVALTLAACASNVPPHLKPLPYATVAALEKKGMTPADPILLRIYKQESELEVWKKSSTNGEFKKFRTYDICRWSGALGPKHKEGDRQAPEGFYHVTPALMNPNSSYHLSFNLGFPNRFDRAHGRTGSHLMVHGACSSAGCYAMEDPQIEEIYALAREAFDAGQPHFQVQAFPFRMTPQNLALHASDENMPFWQMLKEGHDHFEVTRREPDVEVCGRRYVFNAEAEGERFVSTAACPDYEVPESIRLAVETKNQQDMSEKATILAEMRRDEARAIARAERGERGIFGLGGTPAPAAQPVEAETPANSETETAETAPLPLPREAAPGAIATPALAGSAPAANQGGTTGTGRLGFFSRFTRTSAPAPIAPPAPTSEAEATASPADAGRSG